MMQKGGVRTPKSPSGYATDILLRLKMHSKFTNVKISLKQRGMCHVLRDTNTVCVHTCVHLCVCVLVCLVQMC